MCVIYGCEKGVPDEEKLMRSEEQNDDGAGIAWQEKDSKGVVTGIRWVKGLSAKEIIKHINMKGVDFPLMLHFRSVSVGGKHKELCHPFPPGGSLALEGVAPFVVAHNGTWSGWSEALFWTLISKGQKVPKGPMSDSRAIAILAGNHGIDILDHLPSNVGRVGLLCGTGFFQYGWGWDHMEKSGYYQSSSVYAGKRVGIVSPSGVVTYPANTAYTGFAGSSD